MSKMRKAAPLLAHPLLARHVPETDWLGEESLKRFMARHNSIYIKPNTGKQGRGILRLAKIAAGHWELRYNDAVSNNKEALVFPALTSLLKPKRKYILQQGIDLATHAQCPFDICMVLQRPYNTWQLSLTSAKVAQKKDAIVTNVSRGAKDYPLLDILLTYDQKQEPMLIYRDLIDLAHQGANVLGTAFPFRIIGFDMAVDKKGWIWFLEANTDPQCQKCRLVSDALAVERFDEAQAILRKR